MDLLTAMAHLKLTCFHTVQVALDGRPLQRFRSSNNVALLVYLAVERRSHQRSTLAGLLWPDAPEAKARRNLNQILLHLRREVHDQGQHAPFFTITKQTLGWNSESDAWVDVVAFREQLAAVHQHDHADLHTCPTCTDQLAQTIALYQGEFLNDFTIPDSDLFEQWVNTTREQLHRQALDGFVQLSDCYTAQGDLAQAQQIIQQLVDLAPWQEEAHRRLMWLLARRGQRSQALAQYDSLSQILLDELGVPPGEETNTLYDQILAGEIRLDDESSPITATTQSQRTHSSKHPPTSPYLVPPPPPHFVGRTGELEQLQQTLLTGGASIVAIVGMGGAGKTSLATQFAQELRAEFTDGVLWANTTTSDPMAILDSWGRAYGYDFSGLTDVESRASAVRGVLAEKQVLLLLDNVEQTAQVQPLLVQGEDGAVLLTTRDLDVATALNAEPLRLGELAAESSRELLVQILGAERVTAEEEAATTIGELLHHLPLAVEIVAQRLKSRHRMKLAQMVARLQDQQQRLGLEISDRAVRSSFAVSWDALDDALQAFFPLLALFEGRPFAAEALSYLADMDLFAVEDSLYTLTALSLVKEEGEIYYRQHPLLADFAREKLGDAAPVLRRFSDYYYNFSREHAAAYARLQPEWGNIIAAIDAAYQQERWQQVIDYAGILTQTWLAQARFNDARKVHRWTDHAAQQLGDKEAQATNLVRWGEIALEQNEYDEAKEYLSAGLSLWMNLEEDFGVADAQFQLARIDIERGDYEDAKKRLDECLSIRIILGDLAGVAEVKYSQALVCFAYNNLEQAESLLQEALTNQSRFSDHRHMISTLRLLAQVASKNQLFGRAYSFCKEAQNLCLELHEDAELATVQYTLAIIQRDAKDFLAAKTNAEEALTIFRQLGLRRLAGMTLYQLGMILKGLEDVEQALIHTVESISVAKSVQNSLGQLYAIVLLGDLHHSLTNWKESKLAWQEAEQLALQLNHDGVLLQLAEKVGQHSVNCNGSAC